MYPDRELRRLAIRKIALRRHLAVDRAQCAAAAAVAVRPLAWLDRAVALWRRLTPFAGLAVVPLGLLTHRLVAPKLKFLGTLARWGPLVLGAVRGLRSAFKTPAEATDASRVRGS